VYTIVFIFILRKDTSSNERIKLIDQVVEVAEGKENEVITFGYKRGCSRRILSVETVLVNLCSTLILYPLKSKDIIFVI